MTAEFADQLGTFDQPWKASSNLKIKSSCFWLTTGTNQPHIQSNKSIFELVTQTFRKACKTWKWVTYKMFALARLASLAMVRELPNSCFFKQYENSYIACVIMSIKHITQNVGSTRNFRELPLELVECVTVDKKVERNTLPPKTH